MSPKGRRLSEGSNTKVQIYACKGTHVHMKNVGKRIEKCTMLTLIEGETITYLMSKKAIQSKNIQRALLNDKKVNTAGRCKAQ